MSNPKQTNPRVTSGFGSVLKSITRSLKPALGNVPVVINAKVVGGGADMQKLLLQLQYGTINSRAQVACQITEALEKYSLSSIPEVWYLARDLCDPQNPSAVRRSALKLLVQCIKKDEDAVSSKLMFYSDIVSFCTVSENKIDEEFDLFLQALQALTKDGRDIHDLYIYDQDRSFAEFLYGCFKVLAGKAGKYKDGQDPTLVKDRTFHNIVNLTEYTSNCVQYNYALTEDRALCSILAVIVELGFETTNSTIISQYLELIKYGIVMISASEEVFQPVIKLLCYIYTSFPRFKEVCSDLIKQSCADSPTLVISTLGSVIYNTNVLNYRDIDPDASLHSEKDKLQEGFQHISACLGSISILESVFIQLSSDRKIPDIYVAVDQAYDDIVDALSLRIAFINSAFLSMFGRLFDLDEHQRTFSKQSMFSKLFPFYLWYSTSRSIFNLLRYMDINSSQDHENWLTICDSLLKRYLQEDLAAPKEALADLFLIHPSAVSLRVASFVIDFYKDERLCTVIDSHWKGNCQKLLSAFFYNTQERSAANKVRALQTIKDANETSLALFDDSSIGRTIILELIERSLLEEDNEIVEYLFGDFLFEFLLSSPTGLLKQTLEVFSSTLDSKPILLERQKSVLSASSRGSGRYFQSSLRQYSVVSEKSALLQLTPNEEVFTRLAETASRYFITSASTNPSASVLFYEFVIKFLHFCIDQVLVSPLIALLRSLVRLRVTNRGVIYFAEVTDMGGLASAFKRGSSDPNFDGSKTILWEYPESKQYIPETNLDKPTKVILRSKAQADVKAGEGDAVLDIGPWLSVVQQIITGYYHWEIFSFVWAHYCSQLSNMALFENQEAHILELQKTVCDQLVLHLPTSEAFPTEHTSVTKSDLQVALVRILSSLLGYHAIFSKADEDQVVSSIIFAMGSYERTAIPCIHILNVCCYEIPLSIKKFLTAILTRLQTGVTSSFASPPTLEFMMSVISLRTLTSSFTIDDYKRFFAIAFKYIQYASMLKAQMAQNRELKNQDDVLQQHGVDAEVEKKASTQITPITPIMNEYLSLISYKLIARLFLTINLSERRKLSPFILRNLVVANQIDDKEIKHEPTVALADFLVRFSCGDIPLKVVTPPKPTNDKVNEITSSWLLGRVVLTISTNSLNGDSTITVRRPASVAVFRLQLDPSMLQTTTHADGSRKMVLNSYFLLQVINFLDVKEDLKPIPLLDDAATSRAIGTLDRTPVVSFHKAGVIYIGPGQSDEKDILGNTVGSPSYHRFLDQLGKLIRLKDADSVYAGGLDKENGSDGEYAYIWNDTISQTVFHVTTLMPNVASDKYHSFKKRHIGNNHVNVYFDESGHAFNFNIIKSQFNFLNIVITPHTALQRTVGNAEAKVFKVKTFRRHGVPGIFSTTHFKLISAEQLPILIRNAILISDKFAQVWHNCNNGEYVSNWQLRVRQIDSLRVRTMQLHRSNQEEQEKQGREKTKALDGPAGGANMSATDVISSDMTNSFLEQLQGGAKEGGGDDTIQASNFRYEYVTQDDHGAYQRLEFGSYT